LGSDAWASVRGSDRRRIVRKGLRSSGRPSTGVSHSSIPRKYTARFSTKSSSVKPSLPCGACADCSAGKLADCKVKKLIGLWSDGCLTEKVAVPADKPHIDIVFCIDCSGSMGPVIANVRPQSNRQKIWADLVTCIYM